jgi:hypothetical protein
MKRLTGYGSPRYPCLVWLIQRWAQCGCRHPNAGSHITLRTILGDGRFLSMTFAPKNHPLAFEWLRPGQEYFEDTQIYLVDVDGSNLRQLTANDSGSHRWLLGNYWQVWGYGT